MPRKAVVAPAAVPTPLSGLSVAISGSFSGGRTHAVLRSRLEELGADFTAAILPGTTHLIASQTDADKRSSKVKSALLRSETAIKNGIADGQPDGRIHIVSVEWLEQCYTDTARVAEDAYVLLAPASVDTSMPPTPPDAALTDSVPAKGGRRSSRLAVVKPTTDAGPVPLTPDTATTPKKRGIAKSDGKPPVDSISPNRIKAESDDEETPKKKQRVDGAGGDGPDGNPPPPDAAGAVPTPPAPKQRQRRATIVAAGAPGSDANKPPVSAKSSVKKEPTKPAPNVPLDEGCNMPGFKVYIDPSDGIIYDVSLNQTNAGHNNNKFYRIQIIHNRGKFNTWTRWGRVGERGQSKLLGDGTFDSALKELRKKFKDKSGLQWENRTQPPLPKKYVYIERNYDDSSDEEGDSEDTKTKHKSDDEDEDVMPEVVESKLHPAIQTLLTMIFDVRLFQSTFQDLNYDANKLPLGKLSKSAIQNGFGFLKNLSELIAAVGTSNMGLYTQEIETQSNMFYSQIPHAFGRNRPPVISTMLQLKKEIELLESLSDMKAANDIIRDAKNMVTSGPRIHPLDQKYGLLRMDEMSVLEHHSCEFIAMKHYLISTQGSTHSHLNFTVLDIYRITRQGEADRFITPDQFAAITAANRKNKDAPIPQIVPGSDKRLLWHGSRCTNFGGILSQGLRIAPPEAPSTGYMFGKGVYLADMASKSAGYCCSYISDDVGLLLLCEAELGDPMFELTDADYDAGTKARAAGKLATWGKGQVGPARWMDGSQVHPDLKGIKIPDTVMSPPGDMGVPNAMLRYNEYICYDVSQIRLRYLFRVKMK